MVDLNYTNEDRIKQSMNNINAVNDVDTTSETVDADDNAPQPTTQEIFNDLSVIVIQNRSNEGEPIPLSSRKSSWSIAKISSTYLFEIFNFIVVNAKSLIYKLTNL